MPHYSKKSAACLVSNNVWLFVLTFVSALLVGVFIDADEFEPGTRLLMAFEQEDCFFCDKFNEEWKTKPVQGVVTARKIKRVDVIKQEGLEQYNVTITPTLILYRIDSMGKAIKVKRSEGLPNDLEGWLNAP